MNKLQRGIVTVATIVGGIFGGIKSHNSASEFKAKLMKDNQTEMFSGDSAKLYQQRYEEMQKLMGNDQAGKKDDFGVNMATGMGIGGGALAGFLVSGGLMLAFGRKTEPGYGTPKNKKGNGAQP